jgi:hypothetical protein
MTENQISGESDILRIHAKSPNYRYVDELNRFAEPNIRLDFLILEWYWISTALRYFRVRGSSPALLLM